MMTVVDQARYQRHREARTAGPWTQAALHELGLPILLFGSMGAIAWAIRGTGGWSGVDGTVVPGMTWGLLWYYLCYRKGIDARGIALWLGLGIAIGGELGYGQYISWIQGRFEVGEGTVPVAPWVGYAWLVICGIGWGAPGGIILGWVLHGKASLGCWLVRSLLVLVLLTLVFNLPYPLLALGAVDWLGKWFVQSCPWLLFPNSGLEIYTGELGRHLERTVYTNTQNFAVLVWWVGAMVAAAVQRDRATLTVGALIGGGFGIGFMLAALWCLGYAHAPGYIDWWKMWELNAGFNLGLLYVLALWWATRQVDKAHGPNGVPLAPEPTTAPPNVLARRRSISLTLSAFFLVFILFFGGSSRTGVLLGLYDASAVDQYAWPPARMVLFAPFAIVIVAATVYTIWRTVRLSRTPAWRGLGAARLPERMADLMTVIAVVGAATIWPAKIGALYALFLCFAIFALNRLNRRLDAVDAS